VKEAAAVIKDKGEKKFSLARRNTPQVMYVPLERQSFSLAASSHEIADESSCANNKIDSFARLEGNSQLKRFLNITIVLVVPTTYSGKRGENWSS